MTEKIEPTTSSNQSEIMARMEKRNLMLQGAVVTVRTKEAQDQERDSFFKTALLAFVANFFAHNTPIPPEQIVGKCAALAELTWDALQEYRARQNSGVLQSVEGSAVNGVVEGSSPSAGGE